MFSSFDTCIFICCIFFFTTDEVKSDNVAYNQAINFLTVYLIAFDIILLSDLSSNANYL